MRLNRAYIEITNDCNKACSFCIRNDRLIEYMSVKLFEDIVKQIKPYTTYLYLHVLGETLLHPQLPQLLKIANDNNMQVHISTNASLLDKWVDTLVEARCVRQINLSMHSFNEEEIALKLERILEIADILTHNKIHVNMRLWSEVNNEIPELSQMILDRVLKYYHYDLAKFKQKKQSISEYFHLHIDEVFEWPTLDSNYISDKGKCKGVKNMIAVLVDGSVVPCCFDTKKAIDLGNIKEKHLEAILASEKANNIRKGFEDNKCVEKLCQRCTYRNRFNSNE